MAERDMPDMPDMPDDDVKSAQSSKKFVVPDTPEMIADRELAIALDFMTVDVMTLPEMIYLLDTEAHKIEGSQRARIIAGMVAVPDSDAMGIVARLNYARDFIKRLHEKPAEAAAHFAAVAKKRNSRE